MTKQQTCPYGTWPSPITAQMLSGQTVRLGGLSFFKGQPCWLEGRSWEAGRSVLVREEADGQHTDLIPAPYNVRSRVHEYGGGAYGLDDGRISFSHDADQRLYLLQPGTQAVAITQPGPYRYADMVFDKQRGTIICVREEHRGKGDVRNALVAIDLQDKRVKVLASGHDFYSNPCLDPDAGALAYLCWDHPNMPWDGTCLWRAAIGDGGYLDNPVKVAGGLEESIFQPQWSPDGRLYFVSDRSGFWNLYRQQAGAIEAVLPRQAEFGLPQWQFAMSTYAFATAGILVGACCAQGIWQVQALDIDTGTLRDLPTELTAVSEVRAAAGKALILGASALQPQRVLEWDLHNNTVRCIKASTETGLDSSWLSSPQNLHFESGDQSTAHGFFYPPQNPQCNAPAEDRPPLIVISHGGPTGATCAAFSLAIQYWTSRGFAVLDVNYRGSTGYGRHYRSLLDGGWGEVDVADCVNGARALLQADKVDPERLAIRGSSAGGYTTLAALTFHDLFRAGASYYGIGELQALARDTHKFEARYLDRLIGPYPEAAELYHHRSPINHVQDLSCPVIFFQGLEDKVVPPNQALMMRDALREKGIPVACLLFEGEQHGFRQADTIYQAIQAELYFYSRVFGFTPADSLPQVDIENL